MRPANTERNSEIIARREKSQFPRQIAREMSITKNAVIGVCFRAGLSTWGNQYAGLMAMSRYERSEGAVRAWETRHKGWKARCL